LWSIIVYQKICMHTVTLFLINPQGELQAIFEPGTNKSALQDFNPDTVVRDYLAIRVNLG